MSGLGGHLGEGGEAGAVGGEVGGEGVLAPLGQGQAVEPAQGGLVEARERPEARHETRQRGAVVVHHLGSKEGVWGRVRG